MAEASKRCTKCGVEKLVGEFYLHTVRGRREREYHCKACRNAAIVARREANPEKERQRRTRVQSREQVTRPERRAARLALQRAVREGKLLRPTVCDQCGTACHPHGHHSDYARPLDVQWLCARCHAAEHVRLRAPAPPVAFVECGLPTNEGTRCRRLVRDSTSGCWTHGVALAARPTGEDRPENEKGPRA
jgi:hypothetical protein